MRNHEQRRNNRRQALMAALASAIGQAPPEARADLAEALQDYAVTFHANYCDLAKGNTLVANLLSVIEEAADARIEHRG